MPLAVTLDDKYVLERGRVYLTGTQALVRLPMMQRQRDLAAGLNTGGYISGYRGSPLGGFDQALWQAKKFLKKSHIEFQPGVNEDLAATAVWGTQQVDLYPGARYDGVFGMWYGKGPGVDRSGDVFKHANLRRHLEARRRAGARRRRPHGEVVDRRRTRASSPSCRRRHAGPPPGRRAGVSRLRPARLRDVALFGLLGRLQGPERDGRQLGLGLRRPAPGRDRHRPPISCLPPDGVHIRWPDDWLGQERRVVTIKLPAALRLRPRQRARPADARPPRRPLRHRHRRQVLSRRAPGAGRAGHRRRRGRAPRPRHLQGRHGLAAGDRGRHRLRRRQATRSSSSRRSAT